MRQHSGPVTRRVTSCPISGWGEVPTAGRVMDAARIKVDHSMGYADAFADATAVNHEATLWTGDP